MQWIIDNAADLIEIASLVIAIAAIIASMTPTPKDDGIVKLLRKIVDILAFNFGGASNAENNTGTTGTTSKGASGQAGKK